MIILYANLVFIIWFIAHYLWITRHERYLNRLRDYDSRCQIEAERKARDER